MRWLQQMPQVILRAAAPPHHPRSFLPLLHKCYSVSVALPPDIAFDELQQKLSAKQVILIDVRLPNENTEHGKIPNSINLPLQKLGVYILQPDQDFEAKRGFSKPTLDEPLVVSCRAGVRARTAQLALMGVGYSNVRVYVGSFEDWVEKGGELEFPKEEEEQ